MNPVLDIDTAQVQELRVEGLAELRMKLIDICGPSSRYVTVHQRQRANMRRKIVRVTLNWHKTEHGELVHTGFVVKTRK